MFIFKELILEASEVTYQAKVFTVRVWQTQVHTGRNLLYNVIL